MAADFSVGQKVWALLTGEERRELVVLFALMLIAMLLETLGVGLVFPALALFTTADVSGPARGLRPLLGALGVTSPLTMIVGGMLAIVAVYLVKNVFLAIMAWRQSRFSHELSANLSQRLLTLYLAQPYTFHLQRNSAHLLNNISGEVEVFTSNGVTPGLTLGAESLVLAALGMLLLVAEPAGAVVAGGMTALAGWGSYRLSHRHAGRWGRARQFHGDRLYQHLQQGLGAVKEIILLGREKAFLDEFYSHTRLRADAARRHDTLNQMPRLALELLAILALAVLTFFMVWRGRPPASILPILGLFTAVAFRVMPSANRILFGLQSVRYALPAIDRLHDDFATLTAMDNSGARSMPLEGQIEVDSVAYTYPGSAQPTLSGVALNIARGESIGIIGASGTGKSTLIDVVLGLLPPTAGRILVSGRDIRDCLRGWQDQIGYVPQVIYFTDDTLRRNIAFGLSDNDIDEAALWRAVCAARLDAFVNALPAGLDTIIGERGVRISGGERQRVGIARALYHDPSVLVFDEATNALDTLTEQSIMDTVHDLEGRKTILIVSHRLATTEHCDRVYRLEEGRLTDTLSAVDPFARGVEE